MVCPRAIDKETLVICLTQQQALDVEKGCMEFTIAWHNYLDRTVPVKVGPEWRKTRIPREFY